MKEESKTFFDQTKGNLIVSCQALEDEPLHGPQYMTKMAIAAYEGGAVGLRVNGRKDIQAIKQEVDLPIIGLVKQDYKDSEIFITPTKKEVDELLEAGADVIAMDATQRTRPHGELLNELIHYIQANDRLVMADISTKEEGITAEKLGVDCISTTLSGYTPYSPKQESPDFKLIEDLVKEVDIPVLAEGRIWSIDDATKALSLGAHAVVIGSAITRPQLITKHFFEGIKKGGKPYESTTTD